MEYLLGAVLRSGIFRLRTKFLKPTVLAARRPHHLSQLRGSKMNRCGVHFGGAGTLAAGISGAAEPPFPAKYHSAPCLLLR